MKTQRDSKEAAAECRIYLIVHRAKQQKLVPCTLPPFPFFPFLSKLFYEDTNASTGNKGIVFQRLFLEKVTLVACKPTKGCKSVLFRVYPWLITSLVAFRTNYTACSYIIANNCDFHGIHHETMRRYSRGSK